MAEANHRLAQSPTIRITTASHVLAQLRARNAVKRELQKQGLKVSHYSASEISSWARLYLEDHHEALMPEAIASARAMILGGVLGKRVQKEFIKELKIEQSQSEGSVANGQS
jgi:ribosome biogenesis SPOUT family RNA methylase Rps3